MIQVLNIIRLWIFPSPLHNSYVMRRTKYWLVSTPAPGCSHWPDDGNYPFVGSQGRESLGAPFSVNVRNVAPPVVHFAQDQRTNGVYVCFYFPSLHRPL